MKKLGIVGGVAWPSTLDYYRAICSLSVAQHQSACLPGPPSIPEMTIESLNINKSFSLRGGAIDDHESWSEYDAYFRQALVRLEAAGADVAIIASNTPHNRFDSIIEGITIPVISIFSAVADECNRLGIKKMLILGTAPTMNAPNFADLLSTRGIAASAPSRLENREAVVALISELYSNRIDGAAERIRNVVNQELPAAGTLRSVCLACTELPMAFPQLADKARIELADIQYINTTVIHARAAYESLVR
jgi:aspartate racemase